MFKDIMKKLRYQQIKKQIKDKNNNNTNINQTELVLSKNLAENLKKINEITSNSNDIIIREFSFGHNQNIHAALVFIDGLVDTKTINDNIIEPLMYKTEFLDNKANLNTISMDDIKNKMLSISEVIKADTIDKSIEGFLSGNAALMIDGFNIALIINAKGWEHRNVTEPLTEAVIRGPREGFTENLRTNTSLIRRKIKSSALTTEVVTLGEKTQTVVCIAYIKGLANDDLIQEIRKRLNVIDTDSILDSGYIEQYIEDAPFSLFSTIAYTEKPDVVASKLLEGRVAIIVDGSPFVLTAPMLFMESFQSAEDYYSRPFFMSMLRIVRLLAFLTTILAPAFYVAITTFHQELIPTDLLFTMVAAREGIPFPAVVEAAIMIIAFEILREAGVRLPRPVGQTMSIVGALVMGDAAVSAGLIGAPMVIVIAITAVSIFAVPTQADAAAIIRIILLILAGTMGGFGITIGLLFILVHLSSLKSFGFAYLSPIAPFQLTDTKDTFFRAPLWTMHTRPNGMAKKDQKRQGSFIPLPMSRKQDGEED